MRKNTAPAETLKQTEGISVWTSGRPNKLHQFQGKSVSPPVDVRGLPAPSRNSIERRRYAILTRAGNHHHRESHKTRRKSSRLGPQNRRSLLRVLSLSGRLEPYSFRPRRELLVERLRTPVVFNPSVRCAFPLRLSAYEASYRITNPFYAIRERKHGHIYYINMEKIGSGLSAPFHA